MKIKALHVALALLAVGLVVVVGPAVVEFIRLRRKLGSEAESKRREFETDLVVKSSLPVAIDLFKLELRKLPPMTVAELRSFPRWADLSIAGNTTNESSECLLAALRDPQRTSPLDHLPGKQPLGNTDRDSWNKVPDGSTGQEAREILDGWGNPVVYIKHTAYDRPVTIVNRDGRKAEVRAVKRRGGAYYNRDSYQLISLGEDGVQSDDDRENFTRDD